MNPNNAFSSSYEMRHLHSSSIVWDIDEDCECNGCVFTFNQCNQQQQQEVGQIVPPSMQSNTPSQSIQDTVFWHQSPNSLYQYQQMQHAHNNITNCCDCAESIGCCNPSSVNSNITSMSNYNKCDREQNQYRQQTQSWHSNRINQSNTSNSLSLSLPNININNINYKTIIPSLSSTNQIYSNPTNPITPISTIPLPINVIHPTNYNTIDNKNKNNTNLTEVKRGRKKIDRSEFTNDKGRYQCRLCTKSYKRYNDLKGHLLVHQQGTKSCPYCKKKFSRPIYLRDHIRTHTGERPFECDICHKRFAAKRNLVQHRKRHFNQRSRLIIVNAEHTM